MKRQSCGFLLWLSWITFLFRLWDDLPPYWPLISILACSLALYCTARLAEKEASHRWSLEGSGGGWLILGIAWALILNAIADRLPPYWSKIFPLLTIPVLYLASLVYPKREPEEKQEDVPSQESPNQEHSS